MVSPAYRVVCLFPHQYTTTCYICYRKSSHSLPTSFQGSPIFFLAVSASFFSIPLVFSRLKSLNLVEYCHRSPPRLLWASLHHNKTKGLKDIPGLRVSEPFYLTYPRGCFRMTVAIQHHYLTTSGGHAAPGLFYSSDSTSLTAFSLTTSSIISANILPHLTVFSQASFMKLNPTFMVTGCKNFTIPTSILIQ